MNSPPPAPADPARPAHPGHPGDSNLSPPPPAPAAPPPAPLAPLAPAKPLPRRGGPNSPAPGRGKLLEATAGFFKSQYLPDMCLFSGRVDSIHLHPISLTWSPSSYTSGGALIAGARSRTYHLELPAAPGEFTRWRMRMGLPFGIAMVLILALIGLWNYGARHTWAAEGTLIAGFGGGIAIVFLAGFITTVVMAHASVRLKASDGNGNIDIYFPESREHIYWEYQDAFRRYMTMSGETGPLPKAHARTETKEEGWEQNVSAQ